jgi:hypothetical protein
MGFTASVFVLFTGPLIVGLVIFGVMFAVSKLAKGEP